MIQIFARGRSFSSLRDRRTLIVICRESSQYLCSVIQPLVYQDVTLTQRDLDTHSINEPVHCPTRIATRYLIILPCCSLLWAFLLIRYYCGSCSRKQSGSATLEEARSEYWRAKYASLKRWLAVNAWDLCLSLAARANAYSPLCPRHYYVRYPETLDCSSIISPWLSPAARSG